MRWDDTQDEPRAEGAASASPTVVDLLSILFGVVAVPAPMSFSYGRYHFFWSMDVCVTLATLID